MNKIPVQEISIRTDVSKVEISGLVDEPGVAAEIFTLLGEAGLNVELVSQSYEADDRACLSFVVREDELEAAVRLLNEKDPLPGGRISTSLDIGLVTVSGGELAHTPGAAGRMFKLLSEKGINIRMISTSMNSVTCAIERSACDQARDVLLTGFEIVAG